MKKFILPGILIILFAVLLGLSLSVKRPETEVLAVESLAMHEEYVVMTVGESKVLLASVYPYNANNQTVLWSSSNEQIATVENGIVQAHQAGNVQIIATSEEGGYQDYCYVDIIYS
jgi:uncharacterized protein YjdB